MDHPIAIAALGIGCVIRSWGAINHLRSPLERPLAFSSDVFSISVALVGLLIGLLSSVALGMSFDWYIGFGAFVGFWFSPRLIAPILIAIGF